MDIASGIILGAVQGITEFLPVSSSGHLILARAGLGLQTDHGLAVDAVLQLATVLAVALYFFRDLLRLAVTALRMLVRKAVAREDRIEVIAIVIGTIPAVVLGLLLEDAMATVFRDPLLVAGMLVLGSGLFWYAERVARQDRVLTVRSGVLIGVFQTLALVPGVSRSGATISGGLILGLPRERAARFSFLLAFPVIFGSGMKKLLDLGSAGALSDLGVPLAFGFITAFLVGIGAIHWLLRFLRAHSLRPFAVYRVLLAIAAVILIMQ